MVTRGTRPVSQTANADWAGGEGLAEAARDLRACRAARFFALPLVTIRRTQERA